MLTTLTPGIGVLADSSKSTPSSIIQIGPPLGLGSTILVSISANSPLCPWVRWHHDHLRSAE